MDNKKFLYLILFLIFLGSLSYLIFKYFPKYLGQKPQIIQLPKLTTPISFSPGSCLVLSEKHCQEANLIKISLPGPQTQIIKAVAFNLPKDTLIFAPFDTYNYYGLDYSFQDEQNKPASTFFIKKDNSDIILIGNFQPITSDKERKFNKGEIIAKISSTSTILSGIDLLSDQIKNYNFLIQIIKKEEGSFIEDINLLKSLFPNLEKYLNK